MRYLIIGHGAAGWAAARAIRSQDPGGEVVILTAESHPPYFRPLIPALIDHGPGLDSINREEATLPQGVEVRLSAPVAAIDPGDHGLTLADGQTLPYDRLLIATGGSALPLAVPGADGPGVHLLRTIDDAEAIGQAARRAKRAVVVGGGRVGMKSAVALRRLGLEVSVVEQLPRIVPLQLDDAAAEIVGRTVEAMGIDLVLGRTVTWVERDNDRVTGVGLDDGRTIAADLVVVAIGVRPNADLARAAGIEVNRGVVVDQYLRTSAPDVYAAGDVAETTDLVTGRRMVSGSWTNAAEMGRLAGRNMAGEEAVFPGAWGVLNSLQLAGVPTTAVGLIDPPPGEGYRVLATRRGEAYRKLVLKEGRLKGALLVGNIDGAGVYTWLIKRKVDVGPLLEDLMTSRPSYAPWIARETARGAGILTASA